MCERSWAFRPTPWANGTGPRQPERGRESHESTHIAENALNPCIKARFGGRPKSTQTRPKEGPRVPREGRTGPIGGQGHPRGAQQKKSSAAPSPRPLKKRLIFDFRLGFLIRTVYQLVASTCEFKRFPGPRHVDF